MNLLNLTPIEMGAAILSLILFDMASILAILYYFVDWRTEFENEWTPES